MKVKWNEKVICDNLKVAKSFFDRLIGLMFKESMNDYDGLLLKRTNSIHMFFCRFPIDAIFLNKDLEVIKIYRTLKPWRITTMVWGATQVLEINAGKTPKDLVEGERLEICTN